MEQQPDQNQNENFEPGKPDSENPNFCVDCGTKVYPHQNYCSRCGRKIERNDTVFCTGCGTKLRAGASYCSSCGRSIGGTRRISSPRPPIYPRPMGKTAILINREWTDLRNIIIFYVVMLITIGVVGIIFPGGAESIFIHDIIFAGVICGACYLFWKVVLPPLKRLGFKWYWYVAVGAGSFATLGLSLLFLFAIQAITGAGGEGESISDMYQSENIPLVLVVISMAVFPAIFEELAFRGIIQGKLLKYMKPWQAIVVTGLIFSIIHIRFFDYPLFLTGIYLSWLRWKSGSLYPGMLAHFGHNFLIVLVDWYKLV